MSAPNVGGSSAACRCNGSGIIASVDGEAMDCPYCDDGSAADGRNQITGGRNDH